MQSSILCIDIHKIKFPINSGKHWSCPFNEHILLTPSKIEISKCHLYSRIHGWHKNFESEKGTGTERFKELCSRPWEGHTEARQGRDDAIRHTLNWTPRAESLGGQLEFTLCGFKSLTLLVMSDCANRSSPPPWHYGKRTVYEEKKTPTSLLASMVLTTADERCQGPVDRRAEEAKEVEWRKWRLLSPNLTDMRQVLPLSCLFVQSLLSPWLPSFHILVCRRVPFLNPFLNGLSSPSPCLHVRLLCLGNALLDESHFFLFSGCSVYALPFPSGTAITETLVYIPANTFSAVLQGFCCCCCCWLFWNIWY